MTRMTTSRRLLAVAGLALLTTACVRAPDVVTILHFNDIYEIEAVGGGHFGGLARLASVRAGLKKTSSPVITTLGGDYLSPSAIGAARIDGQPIAGRQMVDVLNAVGVDWATFGNHEFDVSEAAFHQRLSEQKFGLVSSNVTDAAGQPFAGTVQFAIVPVRVGGRDLHLGLIGLTIDSNTPPWVKYLSPIDAARVEIARIRKASAVDAIIALTHLSLEGDQELVTAVPEIDLVLGGHEHENWMLRRGSHNTPIVKADANVRSVAVVTLTFGNQSERPTVSARLEVLDDRVAADPAVEAVARKWQLIAFDAFKKDGFDPDAAVATLSQPLDGRESTVRNGRGLLTDLIAASLMREVKGADLAIFNSGSVRIDDILPPGPLSQYDIIRVLPFGGKVLKATMDGSLVSQVLDVGLKNRGAGGYLQTAGVSTASGRWLVHEKPINPSARYVVAINDFLLTGHEENLGFLTRTNPHVRDVQELRDIRQTTIDELTKCAKLTLVAGKFPLVNDGCQ